MSDFINNITDCSWPGCIFATFSSIEEERPLFISNPVTEVICAVYRNSVINKIGKTLIFHLSASNENCILTAMI